MDRYPLRSQQAADHPDPQLMQLTRDTGSNERLRRVACRGLVSKGQLGDQFAGHLRHLLLLRDGRRPAGPPIAQCSERGAENLEARHLERQPYRICVADDLSRGR